MGGWGFGWRTAMLAWWVLSVVVWSAAFVLTMFDSPYDEAGVASRLVGGVVVGLVSIAFCSPITLVVASLIGLGAGLTHRRRRLARAS